MRPFLIALSLIFPPLLQAQDVGLNETHITAIQGAAEEGDPRFQLILGILSELGLGLPQDATQAARWYLLSAQQGNACAQKRLGLLYFSGQGVPQDQVMGMALVLLGSSASFVEWNESASLRCYLAEDLTESEYRTALHWAQAWSSPQPQQEARRRREPLIRLVSDRPDPQDANERIYGPGTGDFNVGMLRSEFEAMQRGFISKLEDLKNQAEWMKLESVREKIQALKGKEGKLRQEALKDLASAVDAAIGAGLLVECPPAALVSAYIAVQNFKSSAEHYNEAVNVDKEVQALLKMEKTLERDRERHGGRER
jgi:hypothetical protein